MAISIYARSPDQAPPRDIVATITCDGDHGLSPVAITLPCNWWPDAHAELMRRGWRYTPGTGPVHLCSTCSGKARR